MQTQRVVITGMGIISPIAIGKEAFFTALGEGRCGIGTIRSFDTSDYAGKIGAEITDFDPLNFLQKFPRAGNIKNLPLLDRSCQLGLCAALLAEEDSRLDLTTVDRNKASVIMGTTSGTCESFLRYHTTWLNDGFASVSPEAVKKHRHETIANCISSTFGFNGPSILTGAACSAGTYAIGEGFDLLRSGKTDIIFAGGSDAMSEFSHCGFNSLRSLAKTKCQPFDKNRSGLVIGEAAAVLVLETLEHAKRRGARIDAEIVGYGLSCDAEHITAPQVSGESAAQAMQMALTDAGLVPDDIDYISSHGTATDLNDLMETNAAKKVFGRRAYSIPMSSIKSMVGHCFGAAGSLEAAACILALTRGIIAPTVNYETPDPACDLDYVPNTARRSTVNITLSNSFAFGGNNATIILRSYHE